MQVSEQNQRQTECEIWKDIPGWNGLYQASSIGRIKSLPKDYIICGKAKIHSKEKILCLHKKDDGYLRVELNHDGFHRTFPVHQLIALAFLENPDNKPHIDHINTVRDDNRVENLRWVTPKENASNPITKKRVRDVALLTPAGPDNPLFEEKSPDSKVVLQYTKDGILVARYTCCHQVERRNKGFHFSNVARACRGERMTYKGYIWKYEDIGG